MGLAHIDAKPGLFPVNLTDHDFQVDGRMDVIILAKPPEPANGWAVHAFVFLGGQKVYLDRSHGIHFPIPFPILKPGPLAGFRPSGLISGLFRLHWKPLPCGWAEHGQGMAYAQLSHSFRSSNTG